MAPGSLGDFRGGGGVLDELRLHFIGKTGAEDDGVDLVVVDDAAPVEVGGADDGPGTVDHGGFGVQHGAVALVNMHAGFQQIFVIRAAGGDG